MADPVGCVSLAGEVLSACYKYGVCVAGSRHEAKRLFDEVVSLTGILTLIQHLTDRKASLNTAELDIDQHLIVCHHTLEQINNRLREHAPENDGKGTKNLFRKLVWPFKVEQTKAMIQSIEKQKSTLNLALSAHSLRAVQDNDVKLDHITASINDIKITITNEQDSKRQREIFQWLTSLDQRSHHDRICRQRYEKVGDWIFDMREYNEWRQMRRSILWYQGEAGSGKTFLMSHIIEHLSNAAKTSSDALVVYFYFDASTNESLSIETLIGSIIKQICYSKGISGHIIDAFECCRLPDEGFRRPDLDIQKDLLKECLKTIPNLTVVIDAIDESAYPEDVLDLLGRLIAWPAESCHIFTTSRPRADVHNSLPDAILLSSPTPYLYDDISRYLDQRLQKDQRLRKLGPETSNKVRRGISEKADGMIRWAQCLLDEVARLRTDRAIRQALEMLPKSLGELYAHSLSRVNDYDYEIAKQALLWLSHSLHPLKIQALAEAVVLKPGVTSIDPDQRLNEPQDILQILPMLISYNQITHETRLTHHSVREFLVKNSGSSFFLPSKESHRTIAELCLTYLLSSNFDVGPFETPDMLFEALNSHPLLSYAALNWTQHVGLADAEHSLVPLITRLLTPQLSPHYLLWLQIVLFHGTHGFTLPPFRGTAPNPVPIYYAASYNLPHTVQALVEAGADIDAHAGQFDGTPLQVACFRGHVGVANLLLDLGADPYVADYAGRTAYTFTKRLIHVHDSPATRDLLDRVKPDATRKKEQDVKSARYLEAEQYASNVAVKIRRSLAAQQEKRTIDLHLKDAFDEGNYMMEYERLESLDEMSERVPVVIDHTKDETGTG